MRIAVASACATMKRAKSRSSSSSGKLAHPLAKGDHRARGGRGGLAQQHPERDQPRAGEHEREQEGRGVAVAEPFALDEPVARDPRQHRGDQPAGEVAVALQPPAPADRDDLGHEHLEGDPLRAVEEAEEGEQRQRHHHQHVAGQQPAGERQPEDRQPHASSRRGSNRAGYGCGARSARPTGSARSSRRAGAARCRDRPPRCCR